MARSRRFQHGSLFKRGTRRKVWVARWWEDVIGADGTPDRVRRSEILGTVVELPTRRYAERVFAERLQRINSGDHRPKSVRTFRDFVESNWLPEVLPTLKYSTKQHYRYVVRVHLLPAFGDTQLRLITREAVQHFLAAKYRSGLSWKTVKHLRTVFATVMTAAENDDYIETNPVRKTSLSRRPSGPERPSIDPQQVRHLLNSLPEPSRSIGWLLAITGLRVGESLALRCRDVDFMENKIYVRRTVYEGHFDDQRPGAAIATFPCS